MTINTAITPALRELGSLTFDGTTASTMRYAAAIGQLDLAQQKVALSALGLNKQQQETVLSAAAAAASIQKLTVSEVAEKLGMDASTLAKYANAEATDQMTLAMLSAMVASGGLNENQLKALMTTIQQTAANTAAARSFQTLGVKAKIAGAAMMATPVGWITLLLGVLPLVISGVSKLYDWIVVTAEEAYEAAEASASSYSKTTQEIEALNGELETNKERLQELQRLSASGTITLVEQEELNNLKETNAELEIEIARKKELAALDAAKANQGYVQSFEKTVFSSNKRDLLLVELETIYTRYEDLIKKWEDQNAGVQVDWAEGEIEKASEVSQRIFEINTALQTGYDQATGTFLDQTVDYETHVRQLIETYDDLNDRRQAGTILSAAEQELLDDTRAELVKLADDLDTNYLSKYVGEDKQTEYWKDLSDSIDRTLYSAEHFSKKLSELPDDCYQKIQTLGRSADLTAETVNELADANESLSDWMDESGYTAEEVATHFNALSKAQENAGQSAGDYKSRLTDLIETMSGFDEIYSVISAAQKEMYETGGVSKDTLADLSKITDDYTRYLDEENGKIRINIDALRELAQTKVDSNVNTLQAEIDALKEQNRLLEEKADYYLEQRRMASDSGMWAELYRETTQQIEANNQAIENNLDLIGQYQAIQNPWTDLFNVFDSFTNAMEKLAEIQEAVSKGFTISAQKAREFAEVYPEILNNAKVASDGQITLNETVVRTFLDGKQAELKSTVDTDTSKLKADKALLTAKMEYAKAQLDMVKQVGEGEGRISKEVAEYRINTGNALTKALIQLGVDEANALALATAAMAQDEEEFAKVARSCFQNMDENAADAAYNMAQSIFYNAQDSTNSIADIARQAHETALAISKMGDGEVAGSGQTLAMTGKGGRNATGKFQYVELGETEARLNGITSAQGKRAFDGSRNVMGQYEPVELGQTELKLNGSSLNRGNQKELGLNLYQGTFNGTQYEYQASTISLDSYIAQLERDITGYQNAINKIDSQIAVLQALKDLPLNSFLKDSSDGKKASSVELLVKEIDKYRDALEKLRVAQEAVSEIEEKIERATDPRQKILLTRELVGAYKAEQTALHELNNQRDATITTGVQALKALGFAVKYNADTNDLWIENLEHLNELVADSCGEYDTLDEATNALRESTGDLIDTITELNEDNRDSSKQWQELSNSISSARAEILSYLDEIVESASNAIDSIRDVYDTLHQAADEYAESGFITVDTLQSVRAMGQKYLAYLIDENGQLVINEDRIQAIIAARTQQLAIESSLSYVEALRIAKSEGDIVTLNDLLYATEQATDATWSLVYANLALAGLDEDQYQAALRNINAIRAMADSAVQSIGKTVGGVAENLEKMQSGLNDILDYVMDMLRQQVQDQVDALEGMKDAYSEIIDQRKESLRLSKEETSRQKTLESKMKEIAKLQAQIDALKLDDSREAKAEQAKLMEELSELQEDLADTQADYVLEAQEDALDKMEEAYHDEKDKEIDILNDSISSYQKLYDMAICYIESNWDTLYSQLISWNIQYGNVLESEIKTAWDNCLAAAQRYGSYVSALSSINTDIESMKNSDNNVVAQSGDVEIVREMYANSEAWRSASADVRKQLAQRNLDLSVMLKELYGINAVRGNDGVWYIDNIGGDMLYEKYRKYIYHDGGVVGGGDIKSNERLSLLKDKEWVLSEKMVGNLINQMDRINEMRVAFEQNPIPLGKPLLLDQVKLNGGSTINNVTNNNSNKPVEITFGDTIIQGADQSTVERHIKVTRDMVSQIGRMIGFAR